MSKYDVAAIRQKLKQTMSGKHSDPDEFKPEKAQSDKEPIKYRFFILPPLYKGDNLKSGVVNKSMENFFIPHANHWIKDQPHACPRVWDGSKCKLCNFGFDLLKEEGNKDEEKRRKIVKEWMPTTYHMVNIYFTNWQGNPEALRGTVKFYNASKTLIDQWTAALMRDDAGDPDDPQVHGIFFDENAAFVYELQVLKAGKQNSYKTSRFIANNGIPVPMIRNEDGDPDEAKIAKLLYSRHNLWDKVRIPDSKEIDKIYSAIVDGDDDSDGGFDKDETKKPDKKPQAKNYDDDDDEQTKPNTAQRPKRQQETVKEEKPPKRPSVLDDEIPLDDGETKPTNSRAAEKPSKTVTKPVVDDDDDDDNINDLLSQLDD